MERTLGKINWEVIITIIIGLTGVFVAIKANSIAQMQALIARNSALPTIGVDEKIQECMGVSWKESSIIEISNLSGKMNNYQAEAITFLHCNYFASDTAEYIAVEIPIENYYLINIREGVASGLIERKDTAGNYIKIKNLQESIRQYNYENKSGQSIDTYIQTYLRISYTDLLDEKQTLYYSLDLISEKMIATDLGKTQFDKYNTLIGKKLCIDTNRTNEVAVDGVIDTVEAIIGLGEINNIDILEETDMEILNEPSISTIVGSIIGFAGSILGGVFAYKIQSKKQERFAASVLYNDLMSIERYLKKERSSVNLRYSDNWQNLVSNCIFLTDESLDLIYMIYDEAYKFNYTYKCKEGGVVMKEDIPSYEKLQKIMFDAENGYIDSLKHSVKYEMLIQTLRKHTK